MYTNQYPWNTCTAKRKAMEVLIAGDLYEVLDVQEILLPV